MANEIECRTLVKTLAERNESITGLQFINKDPEGVIIKEISGMGLLNYVYRVTSQDGYHSLIIKYGEEKSKLMNVTLSLDRQASEYNALELFDSIYPGSVPQPYCFDKDLRMIAMEDLSEMSVLGPLWRNGEIDIRHAAMLGKVLSAFHYQTHRNNLSEGMWKDVSSKFRVSSMKDLIIAIRFVNIFKEEHPHNFIPEECLDVYRQCIGEIEEFKIQEKLITTFRKEDCIIHSDVHTYSMFLSNDRVVIFDWESVAPGNPAHDVSFIISDHIQTQHESYEKYPDRKDQITDITRASIHEFLEEYLKGRPDIDTTADKSAFMSEVLLFLGCTVFCITLFPATSFMTLTSEQRKRMMKTGCHLMKTHQDTEFNDFSEIVENLLWKGS